MKWYLEDIISDGPDFLVLRVKNEKGHREVAYISQALDLEKEWFTEEDLQMIAW